MILSDDVKRRASGRIGALIKEKYRLDALLGLGGMGAVYSATHRNGSRVALKLLHAEVSRHDDLRARFLREGYAANRVGHPGVVKVIDDDIAGSGEAFLVMELLEGETLEAIWGRRGNRLPQAEVIAYVDQLLDVLAAAHERGVVHRDLKPENLFLTRVCELKVMDFGTARLLDGSGMTRSGELFGTPAFMPPEQASGKPREVDGQSDLWATGALMFTLLTGLHVHEAPTSLLQMVYAATQRAPPVATRAPLLAADVAGVIDVALAIDKAERWMTARAMQTALRNAVKTSDDVGPTTVRIEPVAASTTGAKVGMETIIMGSTSPPREGYTVYVQGEKEKR